MIKMMYVASLYIFVSAVTIGMLQTGFETSVSPGLENFIVALNIQCFRKIHISTIIYLTSEYASFYAYIRIQSETVKIAVIIAHLT